MFKKTRISSFTFLLCCTATVAILNTNVGFAENDKENKVETVPENVKKPKSKFWFPSNLFSANKESSVLIEDIKKKAASKDKLVVKEAILVKPSVKPKVPAPQVKEDTTPITAMRTIVISPKIDLPEEATPILAQKKTSQKIVPVVKDAEVTNKKTIVIEPPVKVNLELEAVVEKVGVSDTVELQPVTEKTVEALKVTPLKEEKVAEVEPLLQDTKAPVELISDANTIIPDGQVLLLRPKVDRLIFDRDLYVLKEKNQLYVSLADAIDIMGAAVDYDDSTLIGGGWFFREDWDINIDLNNQKVVSRNIEYNIDADDIIVQEDETFIAQSSIEEWFNVKFIPDISQQYLEIVSEYPLPSVAQYYRQQRTTQNARLINKASLPRLQAETSWLDLNTIGIRAGTRYNRSSTGRSKVNNTANIALEGQALHHDAYALTSYNTNDEISSVTARLSKRSEAGDLLGPLGARSYTLGDTNVTRLPLTGSTRQELGVRITNSELLNGDFQTTNINGDAIPGWDIELYRNGVLIETEIVGDDGYYQFANIPLFAGDNGFELFFYGPQGEIRSEDINIPVTAALLKKQDSTYDVSATLSDKGTYRSRESNDVDYETPHFAARFNKYLGNSLTYLGVRNRDVEGENRIFGAAGFTMPIYNAIIDGSVGVDDEANIASQLTARKKIMDWNLSASALLQDEEYSPDSVLAQNKLLLSANAQRSFRYNRMTTGVSGRAAYAEEGNDQERTTLGLGLSHQMGRVQLSNSLFYEDIQNSVNNNDNERLDNTISARANLGRYFVRAGLNYDIKPESEIDRYFSQIHYQPNSALSGDLYLDHDPNRDFTQARANLNYQHKNFRTSPFVEIDSDDEFAAGINVNMNIADNPSTLLPVVTGRNILGRGRVSSFVYLDRNSNMFYDRGDVPLPDVVVESLNVKRRAETNDEGYSLMVDLPSSRATDISIDQETLPDPFMISAVQGSSVLPDPGKIYELEFPIQYASEIDGTVYLKKKNGKVIPAKYAELLLTPLSNNIQEPIELLGAFDGFFVSDKIPAGQYLMTVSPKTIKSLKAQAPAPKIITVENNGEPIYGLNLELAEGKWGVPINVQKVAVSRASMNIPSDKPLYSLLVDRGGQSRLLRALQNLSGSAGQGDLMQGLKPIDMEQSSDKEYTRYMVDGNDVEQAHEKCRELNKQGMKCQLDILLRPDIQRNIKTASR